MSKVSNVLRWALFIGVSYGVYTETGLWTALFAAITLTSIEMFLSWATVTNKLLFQITRFINNLLPPEKVDPAKRAEDLLNNLLKKKKEEE